MLTEQERKWLEERKNKNTRLCTTCQNHAPWYVRGKIVKLGCRTDSGEACPFYRSSHTLDDYRDAAEFEARAKVIALHIDIEDVPCAHGMTMFCPAKHFKGKGCGNWCRMRMAHLQAEEEMDQ